MLNIHFSGIPGKTIGQHGNKGAPLAALKHGRHDMAAIGPQHAPVIMHMNAGGHLDHLVDHLRRRPPEEGVPPGNANASHHIKPLFGLLNQFDDFFGRVLKIGIQGNDDVPPGLCKSGHDGGMLAVIPVQKEPDNDAGVLVCSLDYHLSRTIGTPIIHQDDFKGTVHPVAGRKTTDEKFAQVCRFVEHGNDDGNFEF